MTRTALIAITILSSLATPIVVNAMSASASTAPAIEVASAVEPQKAVADAPAAQSGETCARRVKVVYRGYGEGAGNACAK
jgi:hypothetical protein